ncbi:MAG: hypothetical protein IJY72_08185 [Akkermansia sp.]|nr:hypothetical protein [Akkermansia sp.]
MKRIVAILMCLVMVLALCACGEDVPGEMTKETYKQGKNALEIMDKYLAGGIDAAEAEKQLNTAYAAIEAEKNSINPDPSNPNYVNDFNYSMSVKSVSFSVKNFILGLRGEENSLGKVPDCQEARDFLYSTLTGADLNKG